MSARSTTASVVVHGGLERAASTFLQRVVFPALTSYSYREDLVQDLSRIGERHISQIPAKVRDRLGALKHTRSLVSSEGIVTTRCAYDADYIVDPSLTLLNLKALFGGQTRLLLVIRRQDKAIDSMLRYKQRYLSDPDMFLMDYPARRSSLTGATHFESLGGRLLDSYCYYRSLAAAIEILGKGNVTVLVYEDLVNNPHVFFSGLGKLLGEDSEWLTGLAGTRVNEVSDKYEKLPGGYVPMGHIMRRLNNLSGYRLEKILPSRRSALNKDRSERILELFRDENRLLAELFDLDIEKYGYY